MSIQLSVQLSEGLPKNSDKCLFPPSLLQSTIDNVTDLPHPLVFNLSDGVSITAVGVKEFTAEEGTIEVPQYIFESIKNEVVSIELADLPKATFLQLKPAQFYPHITNWKYYLESQLSQNYTTLTKGKPFFIDDRVAKTLVEVNVEDANAPTVIVVDTDTILDVLPLNDIMAAQQLSQNDATSALENIPELSSSEVLELAPFNQSAVPKIFKIDLRKAQSGFSLVLKSENEDEAYNVDLLVALDKFVKLDNFAFETMSQDSVVANTDKAVEIDVRSDMVVNHLEKYKEEDSCYLYAVVFAWDHNAKVRLEKNPIVHKPEDVKNTTTGASCSHCGKRIEKAKLPLHEAFCIRNNVKCSCGSVFNKEIPANHWHCDVCVPPVAGNSTLFKFKHDRLQHSGPYKCEECDNSPEYSDFVSLVRDHKSTSCPAKLHECMFCHLILPQEEETYEDRFTNLTHHENQCGNKTTECFECHRVFKRKDLKSHMRMHYMDKVELNTESVGLCANVNCVNIVDDATNELGLCDICYGPLFATVLDPTHIKLQNRIERRYMLQLTKGCGNSWCQNSHCATASKPLPIKDSLNLIQQELLPLIVKPELPITKKNGAKSSRNELYFCISESVHNKKALVEHLAEEGHYSRNMALKAVHKSRNEDSAREWLARNAISVS
ncbi:uncharacterized protein CXQ87_005255 [Candidozyma duobushaemuli]|uniref:Ubiquitin-protein ligase E3A N-terminal zinc-binding domain-containing protein n=2 Tax=Candidozyma TaxID=3303203 RepID=A0ABX8ID23_9ASCO|nr:uncharacterized protein CXQ87_005255 [[Candida] duobushaemulonis]PVH14976.1 hypothetical protein CXQ87_005255 [[Candida] duobushaemulonis]QWU89952.1 hypothetical protein CA3LBN_004310 [[Candida] haemuloni]